MAKPLKIVLAVLGVLVLLIVVAAIALPLLFDPNNFRTQISEAVQRETGRSFEVGNIELRVFPWLRVAVADARLGNAEGFGEESFAEVRQLGVGVKLFPLIFDRQVQVSSVTLDGMRLNLALDANGRSNWQDLVDRQEEEPAPQTPDEDKPGRFKLEDVDIGGIAITDAVVRYRDAQAGTAYRIEPFNFETGSIRIGKPFDVKTRLIAFSDKPEAQAEVKLSTRIVSDLKSPLIRLEKLDGEIKAAGKKIAGGKDATADLQLKGDVEFDREKQRLETSALEIRVKGAGLDMTADGRVSLKLVADLAAQVFTVEGLDAALKAGGEAVPGGTQNVSLSGKLRYDQGKGTLAFDDGRLQAAGMSLTTQIKGEGLNGERPRLSGPVTVAPFAPRDLLKLLDVPLETSDPKALSQASFKAQYSGSFDSAAFRDLTLTLDETTVQGNLAVTNFETQALEFALRADKIDADRYLPPESKDDAKKPADPGSGDINAIELPTEALEQLNANGTLDIGNLKINGLKLTDVRLKLSGTGRAPKTQEVSAKLYGGNVNLSNRYTPGGTPGYSLKTDLNALSAAPFLQDFLGKDYVSGLGNVSLDLSSRGKTVGDLRQALNGTVAVKVENGAVKGFNLGQILRQGQAMLQGNVAPAESEPQSTDFTTLTATATIVNGVLRSNDLAAASPAFRLAGSGEIDLARETINYTARPTVVDTSRGQGGRGLDELKGLTIPIRLTGNLFSPRYKLDIEDALKDKARGKIEDKLRQELKLPQAEPGVSTEQQLKDKASEKLGDLLFGKKRKEPQQQAPQQTDPQQTDPQQPAETPAPE